MSSATFVPSHFPTSEQIAEIRNRTPEHPLRIMVSACLGGAQCGVDGTSYGDAHWIKSLMALPNVKAVTFCPEDFVFGTPRNLPDIHGGNGFDVLDGKAKVISDKGEDWTGGMIDAAEEMLRVAKAERVDLAILMDMSAACGSQVISDGCRLVESRKYQKGPGVAAALLMRNGIKVVSQRDFKKLDELRCALDPNCKGDSAAKDHHETTWYQEYFGAKES